MGRHQQRCGVRERGSWVCCVWLWHLLWVLLRKNPNWVPLALFFRFCLFPFSMTFNIVWILEDLILQPKSTFTIRPYLNDQVQMCIANLGILMVVVLFFFVVGCRPTMETLNLGFFLVLHPKLLTTFSNSFVWDALIPTTFSG